MARPTPVERWHHAMLGLIIAVSVISGWGVILADESIFLSDAAENLRWSAQVAEALRQGATLQGLEAWWGHHQRQPLSVAPTVVALLLAGENSAAAARISVLFWLALLLWATWRVGRTLRSPETGLVAAAALATMPAVIGFSRLLWADVPLAAMVTLSVWMLLRTRGYTHAPSAALFGLCAGLGLLVKLSLPLFLAPAALASLVVALGDRPRRPRTLLLAGLALLVAAAVFALWAGLQPEMVLKAFVKARTDGAAPGPADYLLALPTSLLGPAHAALLVVGYLLVIRGDRRRLVTLSSVWLWGAVVALSFFYTWDRYLIPALPAAALVIGAGAEEVSRGRRWITAVAAALLLFGLQQSWVGPVLHRCRADTGLGMIECAGLVRPTGQVLPALNLGGLPPEGELSRVTVIPWELQQEGRVLFLGEHVQHRLVTGGRSHTVMDPPWRYHDAMPKILGAFHLVFVLEPDATGARPADRRLHHQARALLAGDRRWVKSASLRLGPARRLAVYRNTQYVPDRERFRGTW